MGTTIVLHSMQSKLNRLDNHKKEPRATLQVTTVVVHRERNTTSWQPTRTD